MSLKDKIKKIINVIENTDIEEIEISSFWGAQKIRLSKKSSINQSAPANSNTIVNQQVEHNKDSLVAKPPSKENNAIDSNNKLEKSVDDDIINKTEKVDSTEVVVDEELEYQKAPLVGTFYLSSKPGEPPFVNVGDKVSKGQTLCIIEAMKIFNEIESDFEGTIIEVLAEDAQPVEFNQPIFSIKESE